MTNLDTGFKPDWVSPPGDTILDLLEEKSWTQAEFAERCGFTKKHVNQLCSGEASISEEAALRLEKVLGGSAGFWLARESQYRELEARKAEYDSLEREREWLKEIPLSVMVKFGWVQRVSHRGQQVAECLQYFGVASVDAWRARYQRIGAAYKASDKFEKKIGSVAAWLRYGEIQSELIETQEFTKKGFQGVLSDIRALTNESDPAVFVPKLVRICAEQGVAVVVARTPPGCPVSGATKWLSPNKALLMLSVRYKTNDSLWFAFFHEAAHLLLHGKKMSFLELKGLDNEHEREANEFAANHLIPRVEAKRLVDLEGTHAAVTAFAKEIGVAPAIVVGRMQNDGLLPMNYLNGLKVRYEWPD